MEANKDSVISQFVGLAALCFYALCWFVNQPSQTLWYIGIGLPWLCLLVGLLLSFAIEKELSWTYCYALSTIMFVVFVSIKKMEFLHQIPYLASCVCFIAYARFTVIIKDYEDTKNNETYLKDQNQTKEYHIQSLKSELSSIKNDTTKIINEQKEFEDYTDEVILLARNKVLYQFCKELLKEIEEYERMDNDIYD